MKIQKIEEETTQTQLSFYGLCMQIRIQIREHHNEGEGNNFVAIYKQYKGRHLVYDTTLKRKL